MSPLLPDVRAMQVVLKLNSMAPGWRQAGPKRISRWLKMARNCFKLAQDGPQMAPRFVQNQFGLTAGYVMKRCPEKPLTTIEEGDAASHQEIFNRLSVALTLQRLLVFTRELNIQATS